MVGMKRDGFRHATLPKAHQIMITTTADSIPARSSVGTRNALSVADHQDVKSMRLMDHNYYVQRLALIMWDHGEQRGKLKRCRWNILRLCKVRWKRFGETSTSEGHELNFSGSEDRHQHGVEILILKDTVKAII